ncbi:hypothetical protein VTN02DRAFT_3373 [Thermoascus thermophilus]
MSPRLAGHRLGSRKTYEKRCQKLLAGADRSVRLGEGEGTRRPGDLAGWRATVCEPALLNQQSHHEAAPWWLARCSERAAIEVQPAPPAPPAEQQSPRASLELPQDQTGPDRTLPSLMGN